MEGENAVAWLVEALCYKPEGWVRVPMRSLDFFDRPNPSSRTMAVGWTQALTEMSASNLPGGKWRSSRKADNLTAICEPVV
jgi:hypothetical protein